MRLAVSSGTEDVPTELTAGIAAIHYERGFDINGALRSVITTLQAQNVRIGGVFQTAENLPDQRCARLSVVDIHTGKSECVTQDRGHGSRSCKLDPRGLAAISYCITNAIDAGVDIVIINKFGHAESEGRGLLSFIADSITAGIPVLTTVREPYVAAWRVFHGGVATELPSRLDIILQWFDMSLGCGKERANAMLEG